MFGAAADESGNIWMLGGWNRTGGCGSATGPVLDSVERLSFDGVAYADQWELTPIVMPTTRYAHSAVITGGFIYVIGGMEQLGAQFPLAHVDTYDILSATWDSDAVPAMSDPRSHAAAITDLLGRIWVIGGYSQSSILATVRMFDPAQPELGWQPGPSLNQARAQFGCAVDRMGRIYAVGGYAPGVHVQTVERIDPCGSNEWIVLPETLPGPTTIYDEAVLGADGYIYVVGGWAANYWTDRVIRLDPDTGLWETMSPLAGPRDQLRLVLGRDDYIYVIGGEVPGCVSTVDVEKLYTIPGIFDDCNGNGIIDERDVDCGVSQDCNTNGTPDECDIAAGTSEDENGNGIPDECETLEVGIDIKPGSYPNSINLGSHGLVPVAVLSSTEFDTATVDPDTVALAGAGVAVRGNGNHYMAHEEDVDGDGLTDLVIQVETENLDPDEFQDGYAILRGETYEGVPFEGFDEITIVPD
jgi:hypothetical protein